MDALDLKTQELYQKIRDHLPWEQPDESLLVLKGHLLCEEYINEYLRHTLPHYECLSGANLQVSTKVALCRASSDDERFDKWIWAGVKKLNKLRNSYAHALEPNPEKIKRQKEEFIDYMNLQKPPKVTYMQDSQLALCIFFLCTAIFAVLEVMRNESAQ